MTGRRGRTRWLAVAAVALVAAVYVANLPFYAGQTFESGLHWRMEHGRLTISQRTAKRGRLKPFWMDWNSEGLRWSAQWRRYGPDDWVLTIPLWIPLGLCLAWCAVSWRRRGAATAPAAAGS
jgi:hypothetical protein